MKHFSWWIWVRALRCSVEDFSTAPNGTDGGKSRRINPGLRRSEVKYTNRCQADLPRHVLAYVFPVVSGSVRWEAFLRWEAVPEASASSVSAQRIQLKYRGRDPWSQQQELISLNFCLPTARLLLASAVKDQQQDDPTELNLPKNALHRSLSLHDFAVAGRCAHFRRSGGTSRARLIRQHMLARKRAEAGNTKAGAAVQPKQQGRLIDISAATVDLISSVCWRGTAVENAANQTVTQRGDLALLRHG